jgi:hypothetical protein
LQQISISSHQSTAMGMNIGVASKTFGDAGAALALAGVDAGLLVVQAQAGTT